MSQVVVIKTQMMEKTFLARALQDLGYTLQQGPLRLRGPLVTGVEVECNLTTPSGHEIGFRKGAQGYEILARWNQMPDLDEARFTQQVTQRYAYHVARSKLQEQGFSLVAENRQADGRIHLVLRRMA
jgi:hypothetical protein